jgi:hypothetical protein
LIEAIRAIDRRANRPTNESARPSVTGSYQRDGRSAHSPRIGAGNWRAQVETCDNSGLSFHDHGLLS